MFRDNCPAPVGEVWFRFFVLSVVLRFFFNQLSLIREIFPTSYKVSRAAVCLASGLVVVRSILDKIHQREQTALNHTVHEMLGCRRNKLQFSHQELYKLQSILHIKMNTSHFSCLRYLVLAFYEVTKFVEYVKIICFIFFYIRHLHFLHLIAFSFNSCLF